MAPDEREFWDEIWSGTDDIGSGSDELLAAYVESLTPGRALELGCGSGRNAVWLAQKGWQVTAVDFSTAAVAKVKQLSQQAGVTVHAETADAASYRPNGHFDLITSFYIQLPTSERRRMLATASDALAPGGSLLFVSHDASVPPHSWFPEERLTLTTPEQVVAELPGLHITEARVVIGAAPPHAEGHEQHDVANHAQESGTTVVLATRPR